MNFINKHKIGFIFGIVFILLLLVIIRTGTVPGSKPEEAVPDAVVTMPAPETKMDALDDITPMPKQKAGTPSPENIAKVSEAPAESVAKEQIETSLPPFDENTPHEVPEPTPTHERAEEVLPTNVCLLSVRCDSILENLSKLKKEKIESIPDSGIIYAEKTVVFYDGESAFDLLCREMEKENIPLDYTHNTMFDSAYVKGIAGLYERDCGGFSGWTYEINGTFQNQGCSKYILKNGDKVEFIYTCS